MAFAQTLKTAVRAARAPGWICDTCRKQAFQQARRYHSIFNSTLTASSKPSRTLRRQGVTVVERQQPFSRTARQYAASRRQPVLPDKPVRTRFAPSPTGHLHIGGLRTALFSYLLAKRTGGQFLLRIEDTDQKRLVAGAEQSLLEDLSWAGLKWDEGPQVGGSYGPYKQSERTAIYQEHAQKLLDGGAAYRCFCSPQTAGQGSAAYVTSGCYQNCASTSSESSRERVLDEPFTVRLKQTEYKIKRTYPDLIYGKITPLKRSPTAVSSVDDDAGIDAADTILIKSDGTPTYHFANVVDDHLMKITHVIRGSEWMASTPLHYDLYHAFGWEPPIFAHVGLLVDENKAKLSKRNNADLALDVKSMREEHGVLPATLVNFLALLGWSNPTQNDVMDMQTLIENFDLKFTKGNTMVRMEKLWYLQKRHVAQLCEAARLTESMEPVRDIVQQIRQEVVRQYGSDLPGHDVPENFDRLLRLCHAALLADSKSYQTAAQYAQRIRYLFILDGSDVPNKKDFYGRDPKMTVESLHSVAHQALMTSLSRPLDKDMDLVDKIHGALQDQVRQRLVTEQMCKDLADKTDGERVEIVNRYQQTAGQPVTNLWPQMELDEKLWTSALMQYLREKLSGGQPGPRVAVVMGLLGYRECCKRLGIEPKGNPGW